MVRLGKLEYHAPAADNHHCTEYLTQLDLHGRASEAFLAASDALQRRLFEAIDESDKAQASGSLPLRLVRSQVWELLESWVLRFSVSESVVNMKSDFSVELDALLVNVGEGIKQTIETFSQDMEAKTADPASGAVTAPFDTMSNMKTSTPKEELVTPAQNLLISDPPLTLCIVVHLHLTVGRTDWAILRRRAPGTNLPDALQEAAELWHAAGKLALKHSHYWLARLWLDEANQRLTLATRSRFFCFLVTLEFTSISTPLLNPSINSNHYNPSHNPTTPNARPGLSQRISEG